MIIPAVKLSNCIGAALLLAFVMSSLSILAMLSDVPEAALSSSKEKLYEALDEREWKAHQQEQQQQPKCEWKDLSAVHEKSTVSSSHATPDGTAFVVVGNTTNITCARKEPLRVLSLSDPQQTNNFDIHRVDCPPGAPLEHFDKSCPSVAPTKGAHHDKKKVICLAPLYDTTQAHTRWFIEWFLYHQILGFDLVVVPDFELAGDAQQVLKHFEKKGFVKIVPWARADTNGDSKRLYEHAKLPAWNRCYLEHAETADWMLFVDIDEVLEVKASLQDTLQWFSEHDKQAFALKNTAVLSVLDEPKNDQLLFAQYDGKEVNKMCPYNCGEFHKGRWKYVIRGGQVINELLWTHSIHGLNYTRVKELMEIVPDDISEIRHYQAHWYVWHVVNKNLSADAFKTKLSPIAPDILEKMQRRIDDEFSDIYKRSQPGLKWAKLHGSLPEDVMRMIRNKT